MWKNANMNLDVRVTQRSWMYKAYLMVIHPCAKYGQIWYAYVKDLRRPCPAQIQGESVIFWCWGQRYRSYRDHECMWHRVPWCFSCAKWSGTPQAFSERTEVFRLVPNIGWLSQRKKAVARTQNHVKNPINLTLRSNVNVVSEFWM